MCRCTIYWVPRYWMHTMYMYVLCTVCMYAYTYIYICTPILGY